MNTDSFMSKEEEYEHALIYFAEALRLMSDEAELQCEAAGYRHVAWEVQHDVLDHGEWFLSIAENQITDAQKAEVHNFLMFVKGSVPAHVLVACHSVEEVEATMKDPCWIPMRSGAERLLKVLPKSRYEQEEE